MDGLRIFIVSGTYPAAGIAFIRYCRQSLADCSYETAKELFNRSLYNYFSWGWEKALAKKGYIVDSAQWNIPVLQDKWAAENLVNPEQYSSLGILKEQIRKFKPDVVWYDWVGADELHALRQEFSSVSLFIGWVGSAIAPNGQWRDLDMVFSCAPESVSFLREQGIAAEHLDHAFDPDVLTILPENAHKQNLLFIGSLTQGRGMHNLRGDLLYNLARNLPIRIHAPSVPIAEVWKCAVKQVIFRAVNSWFGNNKQAKSAFLHKILSWEQVHIPMAAFLKKNLYPQVFGIQMFETLQHALVALNIHADSSPQYASNMRLFETTGVGTCLLTETRSNLNSLFKEEQEVVSYSSRDDCIDKAEWLLEHPNQCENIARAGQARCLRDHIYEKRADEWETLIKKYLDKCRS